MSYRILAVNPGSTSTKIAVFEDEEKLFAANITHDSAALKAFASLREQLPYRTALIEKVLEEEHIGIGSIDAFVGRGGGLLPVEGGVYTIDALLLEHARTCANGVVHPATLGPQIAWAFAEKNGAPAFVVNPPDTDELQDIARITGVKGVYRTVHLHALNLKETAIRHCREVLQKPYEECRLIVCHIGGGISVSAHAGGRMIDGFDIVGGEGPMTPTRCGALSVFDVLDLVEGGEKSIRDIRMLCTGNGGLIDQLGTADAIETQERIAQGDQYASLVWDAMIYQISKAIGAMAAVLAGKTDGIVLGGGLVHSESLVKGITENCGWIAPVSAYPGEFEMEAMAAGALRVLRGIESVKTYSGKRVFEGF